MRPSKLREVGQFAQKERWRGRPQFGDKSWLTVLILQMSENCCLELMIQMPFLSLPLGGLCEEQDHHLEINQKRFTGHNKVAEPVMEQNGL